VLVADQEVTAMVLQGVAAAEEEAAVVVVVVEVQIQAQEVQQEDEREHQDDLEHSSLFPWRQVIVELLFQCESLSSSREDEPSQVHELRPELERLSQVAIYWLAMACLFRSEWVYQHY